MGLGVRAEQPGKRYATLQGQVTRTVRADVKPQSWGKGSMGEEII